MTVTEKDRDILARTLWGEARGEGLAGQIAVAWTIRNRVEMDLHNDGRPDWWGEGYAGVCLKKYQFSCWNKNDPNYPYLSGAKEIPPKQFAQARRAAGLVISGAEPDITGGATHYYATTMPKPPAWAKDATQTFRLGHHIFFKDVP
ncbi:MULTISPECIES: cell wall hydrolase [Pseudomonas]|uniref:cell wall hydrolase n=1 Tax=Pseudomonas TaxID=286 RepID=UPI001B32DE55|nr:MULTISPECIES: cell wall hydrolase [Pseudomonas]MBP5966752.1 cell wall hydrolase [Pseudomonas iridis]UHC84899.1 cell wall hydrolase [Pseudomonas sp. NIBR-H-19]